MAGGRGPAMGDDDAEEDAPDGEEDEGAAEVAELAGRGTAGRIKVTAASPSPAMPA